MNPEARDGAGRIRARVAPVIGVLLALPILGPTPAPAQQAQQLDSGTFRITAGDADAVVEKFAIRREGERFQAAARVTPGMAEEPGAGRNLREFRLQLDAGLQPTFFELTDRAGPDRAIVGVRAGNRMQLRGRSEEGERWQELLLAPGLVVLPEGMAHPYYFVVRMLEGQAEPPLPVIRPRAGERGSLVVEARTREGVSIGGTEISARRLDLRLGEQIHRVWADEQGRILRVEIPDRDWRAVRTAPPGSN